MWHEVLKIRTKSSGAGQAGQGISHFFNIPELPPDLVGYQIFLNATHQNEVMLVMEWKSAEPEPGGSELANLVAFSMKKYGPVNISAWRQTSGSQRPWRDGPKGHEPLDVQLSGSPSNNKPNNSNERG